MSPVKVCARCAAAVMDAKTISSAGRHRRDLWKFMSHTITPTATLRKHTRAAGNGHCPVGASPAFCVSAQFAQKAKHRRSNAAPAAKKGGPSWSALVNQLFSFTYLPLAAISMRSGFALVFASSLAARASAPDVKICRPLSGLSHTCERKYWSP